MRAFVNVDGDLSATIDVNVTDFDETFRYTLRKCLSEAFTHLGHGSIADVWFEDECPDCHRREGHVDDCVHGAREAIQPRERLD